MPVTSLVSCSIALAGDVRSIAHRDKYRPVTWPEVDVLRAVHGKDSIPLEGITVVGERMIDVQEEFERLSARYGRELVAKLFPGAYPQMVLVAPDDIRRDLPAPEPEPEPENPLA